MTTPAHLIDRTESLRLHHRVRVLHGGTGEPFDRIAAALPADAWPHWVLQRRGADVLLSADDAHADARPPTTTIEIWVDDPPASARFTARDNRIPVVVDRDPATPDPELVLEPEKTALEVRLRQADGKPVEDKTVVAAYEAPPPPPGQQPRFADDSVELTEDPKGVYTAPERHWRPCPYTLVIDGDEDRTFLIDHTKPVTRLQFKFP